LSDALIDRVKDPKLQQHLRELGKDPTQINNKNHASQTPLLQATSNNEREVLRALLQVGADPRAKDNRMALHCAIEEANLEAVEALIDAKVDINQSGHSRCTPLHTAVKQAVRSRSWRRGQKEKIVELLAKQPGIDFDKTDFRELTPLRLAQQNNNQDIVGILKQYEATH
jgi:ankyrin repeat protein